MTWDKLAIGDFCRTGSGGTPSRKKASSYFGGNIPWVKSGELREAVITQTEETITELAVIESSAKFIPKGALLVAMYGATIGRVAKLGIDATSSQAVCHILPDESLADMQYMFHALQAQVPHWLGKGVGGAQPNISQEIIKNTVIPLPPLPLEEQRRIAAILDKCDESELLATKATSLYSSLFKASFHSFLRQVEGRESIPQVPLSSVCTRITKGTTPSSLGLPDADGDIPFVRVQDIDKNVLVAESVALQIPMETHHALSRSMLQSGDILVSIAGTIGRVCEVRSLLPHGANCNQAVAIARPIPDVVRPLFLKCMLSDRPAQKQMRGAGVTGTITNLSLSQLGEIKIRCLPSRPKIESATNLRCWPISAKDSRIVLSQRRDCQIHSRAF